MDPKTGTEPAGILKWGPRARSIRAAWLTKKVEFWEKEMESAMVDAQMGRTRRKDLNSSTWVTVHRRHGLFAPGSGSIRMAALSKNLAGRKSKRLINLTHILVYITTIKI